MKYFGFKSYLGYLTGGILLGLIVLSLGIAWTTKQTPVVQNVTFSTEEGYLEYRWLKENLHRHSELDQASNLTANITVSDLPSPVSGPLLRAAGNYYSPALQAYLFHAGTDYAEPEGTVIRATRGGKVVYAGADPLLGQKVTIDCGQGWLVTYGGLDNLWVAEGEQIASNAVLGQVGYYPGAEGVAARSQLHYEIWQGDEVIIPSPEIRH